MKILEVIHSKSPLKVLFRPVLGDGEEQGAEAIEVKSTLEYYRNTITEVEIKRRLEELENEKLKTNLNELQKKLKEKEKEIAYFSQLVIEGPSVISSS